MQVSEKDAPIPTTQHEKMVDKGYKTHTLICLREMGGGYAMMVDADDLVSNQLSAFVKQHPNENGIKAGYVYFVGDDYMKVLPKFSSGSCCIVNYQTSDLPNSYPTVMTENCDENEWIIRKRHGVVVPACEAMAVR